MSECRISRYNIFYDDFKCGFNPYEESSPYKFLSYPAPVSYTTNDGKFSSGPFGLEINSVPFTITSPSFADTNKFVVHGKEKIIAPLENIELLLETVVSTQQVYLNGIPEMYQAFPFPLVRFSGINNANSDIRACSGEIFLIDDTTGVIFSFKLANESIYACYEKFTILGATNENFVHVVLIGKRNQYDPLNDYVKLSIAYNRSMNSVRWLINDEEKFCVNRIGYPLERKYRILDNGMPPVLERPESFTFGFGTTNIMNAYNPYNPGDIDNVALLQIDVSQNYIDPISTTILGDSVPASYIQNVYSPADALFGQGAILRMKYISVYYSAVPAPKAYLPCFKNCEKKIILSKCYLNEIQGVNTCKSLVIYRCKNCRSKYGCKCKHKK